MEFTLDPTKIHAAFAADLPAELVPVVAATQRPAAELAFSEPNGRPAWKELPSPLVPASACVGRGAEDPAGIFGYTADASSVTDDNL